MIKQRSLVLLTPVSPATSTEYLLRGGIVDRALHYDLKGREAREKILERIAAAYVWGSETLESPRFQELFEKGKF